MTRHMESIDARIEAKKINTLLPFEACPILSSSMRLSPKRHLENEIHIWFAKTEEVLDSSDEFVTLLSLWEQKRRLSFADERQRRIIALQYGLVRKVLSQYTSASAKNIHITQDWQKKWYLKNSSESLYFDVYLTDEHFLIAVSEVSHLTIHLQHEYSSEEGQNEHFRQLPFSNEAFSIETQESTNSRFRWIGMT